MKQIFISLWIRNLERQRKVMFDRLMSLEEKEMGKLWGVSYMNIFKVYLIYIPIE